jgi:hypothetical protein
MASLKRDWTRIETYYSETLKEQKFHAGLAADNQAVIEAKRLIPEDAESILDVGSGKFGSGFADRVDVGKGVDFHWLPHKDKSFDLVWARHALEHSPMPVFALMEWKRVSKKYLLIVVPETIPYMAEYEGHWTCLPEYGWRAIFRKTGLRIVKFEMGSWLHTRSGKPEGQVLGEWRYLCQA